MFQPEHSGDGALHALAHIELALERRRRWRHAVVACAVAASALCCAYAGGVDCLFWAPDAFITLAIVASIVLASELWLRRARREAVNVLPLDLRARIRGLE